MYIYDILIFLLKAFYSYFLNLIFKLNINFLKKFHLNKIEVIKTKIHEKLSLNGTARRFNLYNIINDVNDKIKIIKKTKLKLSINFV